MPFQTITWGDLGNIALRQAGGGANFVLAEMQDYLAEALRIWNVITGFHTSTATVASVANQIFYTTTQVTATITEQAILNVMQRHMLETPNNGASLSSDIWTIGEWVDYLNDRAFLFRRLGLVLNNDTFSTVIGTSQYNLLTQVSTVLLKVHRVAWLNATGVSFGLARRPLSEYDNLLPSWVDTNDTPEAWLPTEEGSDDIIEVVPAPIAAGTLDVTSMQEPTTLPQVADGTILGAPTDFTPYIKWGALAEILKKEGQGHDPVRAAYCEQRFQEGLILAAFFNPVHTIRFGSEPLVKTDLFDLDNGNDGWQGQSTTPEFWFPYGATQVGVNPAHLAGGTNFTILGIRDAVIPASDPTSVDISEDHVKVIVGYAQHLAAFKQGGGEFKASIKLFTEFLGAALAKRGDSKLTEALTALYGGARG